MRNDLADYAGRGLTSWTLGKIDKVFSREGFERSVVHVSGVGGQRHQRVLEYLADFDPESPPDEQRLLRVLEFALEEMNDFVAGDLERRKKWLKRLKQDGYQLGADDRLHSTLSAQLVGLRSRTPAKSGVGQVIDRLGRTPADAVDEQIGAAKELIESTARYVLKTHGVQTPTRTDLPGLAKQAVAAIEPALISGAAAVGPLQRLLGQLVQLPVSVGELRNAVGSGHGRADASEGLQPWQGRLAVEAATAWCDAVLALM
jgi:hypothetical protein